MAAAARPSAGLVIPQLPPLSLALRSSSQCPASLPPYQAALAAQECSQVERGGHQAKGVLWVQPGYGAGTGTVTGCPLFFRDLHGVSLYSLFGCGPLFPKTHGQLHLNASHGFQTRDTYSLHLNFGMSNASSVEKLSPSVQTLCSAFIFIKYSLTAPA